MTPPEVPEDVELAAAEYVLGTLDAGERAAFARLLRDDGDAKRAVSAWEHRLAGLAGRVEPIVPPARVWHAIERALGASSAATRTVELGGVRPAESQVKLVASRARWRVAALSLGCLAAAFALVIVVLSRLPVTVPAGGERFIAAVNRGGDKPALLVRVDLATRRVFVTPVAAQTPAGKSLELWYIADDQPPRAMGLVASSPTTMSMPSGSSAAGATVAVSVEPPGGSTTGGPTGPVVYAGQLVQE